MAPHRSRCPTSRASSSRTGAAGAEKRAERPATALPHTRDCWLRGQPRPSYGPATHVGLRHLCTQPLHPLCTHTASTLHPFCTLSARHVLPLCIQPSAPTLHPLCTLSAPSLRHRCSHSAPSWALLLTGRAVRVCSPPGAASAGSPWWRRAAWPNPLPRRSSRSRAGVRSRRTARAHPGGKLAGMAGQPEPVGLSVGRGSPRLEAARSLVWRWRGGNERTNERTNIG